MPQPRVSSDEGKPPLLLTQAVRAWLPQGPPNSKALHLVAGCSSLTPGGKGEPSQPDIRLSGPDDHEDRRARKHPARLGATTNCRARESKLSWAVAEGRSNFATTRAAPLESTPPTTERCDLVSSSLEQAPRSRTKVPGVTITRTDLPEGVWSVGKACQPRALADEANPESRWRMLQNLTTTRAVLL